MTNPDDPMAWVAKADNDLLNIRNNLNDERVPWDTVCFHAQQAAEKLLKAYLVSRGRTVQRTHDLLHLLDECVSAEAPFESLLEPCRRLNPYAVALRYPGSLVEPTPEDSHEANAAAAMIRREVLAALKQSKP